MCTSTYTRTLANIMSYILSIFALLVFLISCDLAPGLANNYQKAEFEIKENVAQTNDTILCLSNSKEVLVIRTDFSSDQKWDKICGLISQSGQDLGFKAYVEYLNQSDFKDLKIETLINLEDS